MRLFTQSSPRNSASLRSEQTGRGDSDVLNEDDVDLFARLLASHEHKLDRVAYRMTGHQEDAEDLLQDALLEAYRSFRRFQRGSYFDKWLYRIMTNSFIDRQRRLKRTGRTVSLDAPIGTGEDGDQTVRDVPDWDGDPARETLRDCFDEPVQRALDSLRSDFRMVLILSDIEDFSYEEIAEIMATPVGTVRSRLHRARADVKKALMEAGYR